METEVKLIDQSISSVDEDNLGFDEMSDDNEELLKAKQKESQAKSNMLRDHQSSKDVSQALKLLPINKVF